MHVLFIGGTGNISSDCAALLAEQGHEISVVTRGNKEAPGGYRKIVADRNDPVAFKGALTALSPDVVIDFVAFRPEQLEPHLELFAGKIEQFIFVSSATVYAKPHPVPVTEDAELGNTWSDYAQNKQKCEEWLAARGSKLPYTIVRPSHTYSPQWIPNAVASTGFTFAQRLLDGKPVFVPDDGQALWTLTTTRDFALGFAGLVGNEAAIGEAVHITNDCPLTWKQIYVELARALDVAELTIEYIPTDFICEVDPKMSPKLRGDKAHTSIFDNGKIKRLVPEFECRDSIRSGLAMSVQWFEEHPDQKTVDPGVDAIWDRIIEAWEKQ
jgi:nucleoside-diphosphate-sugar epimerase